MQSPPRRRVVRVRLVIDEEAAMRLTKLYELKFACAGVRLTY
jgi:predicted DNA-binding protein (UPF0251 family)